MVKTKMTREQEKAMFANLNAGRSYKQSYAEAMEQSAAEWQEIEHRIRESGEDGVYAYGYMFYMPSDDGTVVVVDQLDERKKYRSLQHAVRETGLNAEHFDPNAPKPKPKRYRKTAAKQYHDALQKYDYNKTGEYVVFGNKEHLDLISAYAADSGHNVWAFHELENANGDFIRLYKHEDGFYYAERVKAATGRYANATYEEKVVERAANTELRSVLSQIDAMTVGEQYTPHGTVAHFAGDMLVFEFVYKGRTSR